MPRKPSDQPTEVELAILNVLWHRGPSTVREVHEELSEFRDTGHSTTLKMMQVMHEKGLLTRDDSQRPQIYSAAQPEEKTARQMVDNLVEKVFGGSVHKLILSALGSRRVSRNEMEEIKKLLKKSKK